MDKYNCMKENNVHLITDVRDFNIILEIIEESSQRTWC